MADEHYEIVENQEFRNQNLALTGRKFVNCLIDGCQLLYAGTPVGLAGCSIRNSNIVPIGIVAYALSDKSGTKVKESIVENFLGFQKTLLMGPGVDGKGNFNAGF